MDVVLRTPGPADAERIAALHVATWREAYGELLPDGFFTPEFSQGRLEMWQRVLGEPREDWTVRVAESGSELAGFAFAGPSFGEDGADLPRPRQLYALYVRARDHGTGVGQALLDAVLPEPAAMLWVARDNPRAVAFYRRNGFVFDGAEQVDPAAGIVDLRMVR